MRYVIWALGMMGLAGILSAEADIRIFGGTIHTLDAANPKPDALCVGTDGRFKALSACDDAELIDLKGATVIPGFNEAHGHLMGVGFAKLNLDLSQSESLEQIVSSVAEAVDQAEPGEWIVGRGWHQSKWTTQPKFVKGFQTNETLNEVSPENPVYLVHASGHAAFANDKALEMAGIDADTTFSGDGEIIRDANGRATGVLNERAQRLVSKHIPAVSLSQRRRALTLALEELAREGITSFQDAGASQADIDLYKTFLSEGALSARVYVMITGGDPDMLSDWLDRGPEINLGDDELTIRSIKLVADGALGSRGAWLLAPYEDRANHVGLPTMPVADMEAISHLAYQNGFQVGIHAIGDRANREVLDIFDALFDGRDRGVRYRIEHAQHIDPADIPRFGQLGVIASMQGIHLSSDRPWAIDRLGPKRIKEGAYVWRSLLDTGAVISNGTDAPVESVSALASYYALVSRKTLSGSPEGGFEPEQKLTRFEALRSYTLDAAYAAFEEKVKGSLAVGKWADMAILDRDILTCAEAEILTTRVLRTIKGGKTVYEQAP